MKITDLKRKDYEGFEVLMGYDTSCRYALRERGGGGMLTYELVKTPCPRRHVEWIGRLYESRWDDPRVYGVWDGQNMAALMEITPEIALNRLRITNLFVDEKYRRQGVGRMLVARAEEVAAQQGRRCLVASVQSDNWGAISFGAEMGMKIIGFDAFGYANGDKQGGGLFPLEMGKTL